MSRQPEEPRGGSAGREPTDEEVDRRFLELTSGLEAASVEVSIEADEDAPAAPATDLGGPRDYALAEEPDEPFVPPEPEPLSSADPVLVIAWIGAAGGPLVFLLLVLLWPGAPTAAWWTTLVATLAGWGLVVWRLPRSHDSDDDDGAVV